MFDQLSVFGNAVPTQRSKISAKRSKISAKSFLLHILTSKILGRQIATLARITIQFINLLASGRDVVFSS